MTCSIRIPKSIYVVFMVATMITSCTKPAKSLRQEAVNCSALFCKCIHENLDSLGNAKANLVCDSILSVESSIFRRFNSGTLDQWDLVRSSRDSAFYFMLMFDEQTLPCRFAFSHRDSLEGGF